MAQDTFMRVAERAGAAQVFQQSQGPLRRTVSGAGLLAANTVDRVTGFFRSPGMGFFGGGLKGILRGGKNGFVIAIFAIALSAGAAAVGGTVVLALMGVMGGVFGIYHAQKGFDRNTARPPAKLPDTIAKATGAIPKVKAKDDSPGKMLEQTEPGHAPQSDFAQREAQRRSSPPVSGRPR